MKTTHNLQFECTEWKNLEDETERIFNRIDATGNTHQFLASITNLNKYNRKVQLFKIGTCNGVWYPTPTEYRILFIGNSQKGNGHFDDVLEWFEASCKRDKRALVFEEVMNKKFMKHLIKKRGFIKRANDAIKHFPNDTL